MKRFLAVFVFSLLFFMAAPAYALTSGTTTSGSISTPGGTSNQSFSATAGQGVLLFAEAAYGVHIGVYKPDGSYYTGANSRLLITSLPNTGTYNVVVSSTNPSATGSYSIAYVRGSDSVSNGSLSSGQSYSGTLAQNGLESFQFYGESGQGIMLYGDASYTPVILVFKPDGSYLGGGNSRLMANSIPDTGTYTVVLYGGTTSNSGTYRLDYIRGGDDVSNGSIVSGRSYNGTLDENGLESFQITGKSGEGIQLAAAASYTPVIMVYNPNGSYLGYGNNRYSTALPSDGTYTVVVRGNTTTNDGPYRLDYMRGNDSVSEGTLISAQGRSGTLQVNGIESYQFSGVASNNLSIASTGSYTRSLLIYRPDGSFWTSRLNTASVTLPATGQYTLAVAGSSASNSGGYTVTLTTPPAPTVASDPTKSGVDALDNCSAGNSPSTSVGNPINFDLGYKKQTETDYDGGSLKLTRLYRSDSTWTDNTFGERWRHNYARTLNVSGSAADITDGTGATTHYTLSGSDWVADDSDITAKFETITGGYAYTLPDNTREIYNSGKKLVRIEYVGSDALDLEYDGGGLLETVSDQNGRSLEFDYTSGKVTTVITPEGNFTYTYDGSGNLIEVENPATQTREYHYEDTNFPHAMTGITDENAVRYATYAYDAQGRAILSKHAGDVDTYEVAYNVDGSVTTTNPLGKATTYYFTNINNLRRIVQVDGHASTNCVASNRYYNYYANGWLMSKTDWEGNTTGYARDDRGLVTQIVEDQDGADQRITNISYDSVFNLPEVVTLDNRQAIYDYDTYGRVTSYSVTDLNSSETRPTTYTYYSNTTDGGGNTVLGRVDTITHPNGAITKYTYNGNLLVQTVTDAYGETYAQTTSYTYDAAKRISTITEPNGAVTSLTYDAVGRILTSTKADGTALEAITTYTYDNNGNVTEIEMPNGVTLSYTYDNAQRLTGVEDTLGNTITYTLDDAGNITKEEYKDSTPTLKYVHNKAYDELSRLIQSIGAASQTSLYAYDKNSNLTSYTDANTNATTYSYDGLERLVRTTDALTGETDTAYNPLDDVQSVTDARDNETEYVHNAFGEVTEEVNPDYGSIAYEYDLSGNLTKRTDARSKVTDYTYDKLNRVLTVTYPTDSANDATFTYDSCTLGAGRLCSVTDASGTTAYEYDLLGRVIEVAETRGALSFTTEYAYDLADVVTGITLPSGRVITYGLNTNAQVNAVTTPVAGSPVTLATAITYLPFGPLNAMTYGNSLTFSATYDQDYNPTNRTVSTIYNHTYDTDDNGNIIQIGGTDYGYDALNRLDEEDPGSAVTYTYDAVNNRLTKVAGSTTTTTVPTTSNKISAVGANAYTYDASGNITNDGTREYVWDDAGRLAEVEISSSPVGTYTYNASNQRTKKVAGGNTTHYVYGAGGLLYGEYDNAGDLIREYVYLNDAPLAQINAGSPETLTYLHPDHLGTPKYGTNTGGSQVWTWAPDAFGNGAPSGAVTVNLRMPGQYYDAESGIFYNWNRYYNPEIGRYISSDPIGLEGGMNTFLYVGANPLLYTDPAGLMIEIDPTCFRGGGDVLPCMPIGGGGGGRSSSGGKPGAGAVPGVAGGFIIGDAVCSDDGSVLNSDSEPKTQDLEKIPEKDANKAAQEQGYKDAHDAKKGYGDSKTNLYKDKKTKKIYIWDGKSTTEPQPLN